MSNLLTVKELATALNVPVSWIYDRTRKGGPDRLPHLKLGKYVRFRLDEVLQHLENREEEVGR